MHCQQRRELADGFVSVPVTRGLDSKVTCNGGHQIRPHHLVPLNAGACTLEDIDRFSPTAVVRSQ
jgi:hypothetical protein